MCLRWRSMKVCFHPWHTFPYLIDVGSVFPHFISQFMTRYTAYQYHIMFLFSCLPNNIRKHYMNAMVMMNQMYTMKL